MLIAAVLTIWFLFGGSSGGGLLLFGGMTPHEMHEAVAAIEPDKSKREAIDQTLETIQKETKQLSSDQSKLIDDAFALMKRHETTAEEFQASGARAEALNMSSGTTLLDLRFKRRSQLSDDQWHKLFPTAPSKSK